jgi:hypothetical protein
VNAIFVIAKIRYRVSLLLDAAVSESFSRWYMAAAEGLASSS